MADDEEVVEQEEEVVGTSESESNDNDEPTPIDRSQYDYAPPTVNTSRPWGKSSGLDSNFYAPIEKPGSRQLRVNGKGLTGTWTARKFPYIWVETGVPANAQILTEMGITAAQAVSVSGSILPSLGEPWSNTQSYLKCQDITFQELENGMCEATVNYTSDGYTGDLQIEVSTEEIEYKQPYRFKWEIDQTTENNPYVENLDIKETILAYRVSKKLDYITLANTNHTTYDIDDFQYYITYAGASNGKINGSAWKGFASETVLCTGLSFTPEFAVDGQLLFINVNASFKVRMTGSWNLMWRDPTTEKTSKGADLTWHQLPNQPFPEGAFYTTDPNKIGVKVFVGDVTLNTLQDGSITVTENQNQFRGAFYKPYYVATNPDTQQPAHYYYYWSCNDFDAVIFTPHTADEANNS